MSSFQESTADDNANSSPDSSGLKNYRSHGEGASENGQNMTKINYFDRLPDELLVRIFGDACRYDRPYNESHDDTTIESLSQTCKRFCHIINYFVLADVEFFRSVWIRFEKPPGFYTRSQNYYGFNVQNKPPHWCDYTDEDDCGCQNYRQTLASCKLKYRYLALDGVNLTKKCIPQLIQDRLTNLDWVVQLTLADCVFDSVAIDKILTWLPKIERLSIRHPSARNALHDSCDRELIHEDSPVRTLGYLQFNFINRFDRSLADQLLRLPAKIVDGEIRATETTLGFVREYLQQHRGKVEHFRFRLNANEDSQAWLEYFEEFSVTSARCDGGSFEITSWPCSQLDLDEMIIEPQEVHPERGFESGDFGHYYYHYYDYDDHRSDYKPSDSDYDYSLPDYDLDY